MKAKLIAEARRVIQKLCKTGHKIVFHSARLECQSQATEKWLKKHGFSCHHLKLWKFSAHLCIDDRAYYANDRGSAMHCVKKADKNECHNPLPMLRFRLENMSF